VVSAIQYRRADCDLVLDVIAARIRRPSGGVQVRGPTIAAASCSRCGRSHASSLASLGSDQRVGVPVGSLVSMTLAKTAPVSVRVRGRYCCCVNREIEAAAVTPMTVGWFNLQHADKPLRLIPAFDNDQDLNWNIAAGLLRPDDS
jgi:polar amino acid transport system substrate-binding protein